MTLPLLFGVGTLSARDLYTSSRNVISIRSGPEGILAEYVSPESLTGFSEEIERFLIGIPWGSEYEFRIRSATFSENRGIPQFWSAEEPESASPTPDPSRLLRMTEIGILRDVRIGRVELIPSVQISSATSTIRRNYHRILFEIKFNPGSGSRSEETDPDCPLDFNRILSRILFNGPIPAEFRMPRDARDFIPLPELPLDETGPTYKVLCRGKGLFFLNFEDIPKPLQNGFRLYDNGLDVQFFPLLNQEGEAGIGFYSRDLSPFSPDNAVWLLPHFVGGTGEGMPFFPIEKEAEWVIPFAYTTRLEEDKVDNPLGCHGENQEDDWFWAALPPGRPFEWEVPLHGLVRDATEIRWKIRFAAPKDRLSRQLRLENIRVSLNGEALHGNTFLVEEDSGTGKSLLSFSQVLDATVFASLSDRKAVELRIGVEPPAGSGRPPEFPLFLDWIEVSYPRRPVLLSGECRFPIPTEATGTILVEAPDGTGEIPLAILLTDDRGMARLEVKPDGDRFLVATGPERRTSGNHEALLVFPSQIRAATRIFPRKGIDLHAKEIRVDSLFIVHPDFLETIEPLLRTHEEKGFRTRAVTTEEIYDAFGDGTLSPYAIRDFLEFTLLHWARPAPTYVTLFGDASWDYKERLNNGIVNYVPGIRHPNDMPENPDFPSDNWYVSLIGEDNLPDLFIGRIPVHTAEIARTVVEKIVNGYAPPGPWRARIFAMSDKEEEFNREIESLREDGLIPPEYAMHWLRVRDYSFEDNFYVPEPLMREGQKKHSPAANRAVQETLNRGTFLWNYHGHGAPNVLGNERTFFGGGSIYTDVKKLTNGRMYPLFIGNTCSTAMFDYAQEKWNVCLGEDLLHFPDGGCIVQFLHTGLGYPHEHRVLDHMFWEAMFRYGLTGGGEIFHAAKALFYLNTHRDEPVRMMVLLGDPTTEIPFPGGQLSVEIEPRELLNTPGIRKSIHLRASPQSPDLMDLPLSEYLGYAYLMDSGHNLIWEREAIPVTRWGVSLVLPIPDNLPMGPFQVGCYLYPMDEQNPHLPDLIGHSEGIVIEDPAILEEIAAREIPEGLPNLQVTEIETFPPNPISGETIWIRAGIVNEGTASASNIELEAWFDEKGPDNRIRSWRPGHSERSVIARLYPGQCATAEIRWDPFENAGNRIILVEVDPRNRIRQICRAGNSATAEIHVLEKADLILHASPNLVAFQYRGENSRDLVMVFLIANEGESPVLQDFRPEVRAYRTDDPDEEPLVIPGEPSTWENGRIPFPPSPPYRPHRVILPGNVIRVVVNVDRDDIVSERTRGNNLTEVRIEDFLLEKRETGQP